MNRVAFVCIMYLSQYGDVFFRTTSKCSGKYNKLRCVVSPSNFYIPVYLTLWSLKEAIIGEKSESEKFAGEKFVSRNKPPSVKKLEGGTIHQRVNDCI